MDSPEGQALYLKVHHTLVDGVGGNELLLALFGEAPVGAASSHLTDGESAGGVGAHSIPGLLARSATSMPGRIGRGSARGPRREGAAAVRPELLRRAPASVLGGALGPGRRLALVSLPMADVRTVRAALGLTVNDVAVAVTAGALRNWLGVAVPLAVAGAPVLAYHPISQVSDGQRLNVTMLSWRWSSRPWWRPPFRVCG